MIWVLAWHFVTDQQNFKKAFIVRRKKTLAERFRLSIRIDKKVTCFKYKLFGSKQSFCVDTKDLMVKTYKPVQEAEITGPGFMVPIQ